MFVLEVVCGISIKIDTETGNTKTDGVEFDMQRSLNFDATAICRMTLFAAVRAYYLRATTMKYCSTAKRIIYVALKSRIQITISGTAPPLRTDHAYRT